MGITPPVLLLLRAAGLGPRRDSSPDSSSGVDVGIGRSPFAVLDRANEGSERDSRVSSSARVSDRSINLLRGVSFEPFGFFSVFCFFGISSLQENDPEYRYCGVS